MSGKNNREKIIEKADTDKYILSDFMLLPIKLVCSHLFTKDNMEATASSKEKSSVIRIFLIIKETPIYNGIRVECY